MLRISNRVAIATFIATALILASTGCGGGDDGARLRVMHASPDASSMDVVVDSKTIVSGLTFENSSNYVSVGSGSRHLQIEPSGSSSTVVDETLSLGSGADTTILLANYATLLNAVTLQDDNSAPSSGNAKLRIVNASPALAPADVYIVTDGTDINAVAPEISNMSFESATGYTTREAGTYRIYFTAPGQKFIFIDSGPVVLSSGQVRTMVGMNTAFGTFSSRVLSDLN